jgi:hypothetical protein
MFLKDERDGEADGVERDDRRPNPFGVRDCLSDGGISTAGEMTGLVALFVKAESLDRD